MPGIPGGVPGLPGSNHNDYSDNPPLALLTAVVEEGGTSVLLTFNQSVTGGDGPQFMRNSAAILTFAYDAVGDIQRRYYLREPIFLGDAVYLVYPDGDIADLTANSLETIEYPAQLLTNNSQISGAPVFGDTNWKFWLMSDKRVIRTATVNVVVYGAGNSGAYRAYDNYAFEKWIGFREFDSGDDIAYFEATRNLDGTALVRVGPGGVVSLTGGLRYEVWVKTVVGEETIEIPLEDTLRVV